MDKIKGHDPFMMHSCNPGTQKAEEGGPTDGDQPGLHQTLKTKTKIEEEKISGRRKSRAKNRRRID